MEIEYKWDLADSFSDDKVLEVVCNLSAKVSEPRDIHMHAIYYDTADGAVNNMRGGLRVRKENGHSVCCLKLSDASTGACAARLEYEVEADDIRLGLASLPEAGAPKDVCADLLDEDVVVVCETLFDRRAYTLEVVEGGDSCVAELSFDSGHLRREGRKRSFKELELEHKKGSLEAYHHFAACLERQLELSPQPLSKLARAMQV